MSLTDSFTGLAGGFVTIAPSDLVRRPEILNQTIHGVEHVRQNLHARLYCRKSLDIDFILAQCHDA
jgi:hypothetical protein